jgi:triosephosphate isomerase
MYVINAKQAPMNNPSKLIVANWKMNELREEGESLAISVAAQAPACCVDIVICPPFTLLTLVSQDLAGSPVALGGQDCHPEDKGAFTGDISARMLRDVGATYVIVGHSERRAHYKESSEFVAAKAKAALRAGITPIICVGETEDIRKAGHAESHVANQLLESLPEIHPGQSIVVAYEPTWAIGTGHSCSSDQIVAMHGALQKSLINHKPSLADTPILYGGSVKPENAGEILGLANVGGALVGGASLQAASFLGIVAAAKNAVGPAA